jgi:hypothetical protein
LVETFIADFHRNLHSQWWNHHRYDCITESVSHSMYLKQVPEVEFSLEAYSCPNGKKISNLFHTIHSYLPSVRWIQSTLSHPTSRTSRNPCTEALDTAVQGTWAEACIK